MNELPANEKSAASYEDSLEALNHIIQLVENPATNLDDLLQHVKDADKLIRQCKDKLSGMENDLNEIL